MVRSRKKLSNTYFRNYTSQNFFLKDFRHWWLAALLFLFAMHMQSLKLHPPRIKSNSALRTLRQALCSWRQVLCQWRQALCPATHKFLLPLVISAQWKGLKRKQSTAFIGLGMYCPVQKWHVETWNSDCEPSKEYEIVSRQVQLSTEYRLKEYYAAAAGASMEVA